MALMLSDSAFPVLDESELKLVRRVGELATLAPGDVLFESGEADVDFFVVLTGKVEVVNPTDDDRHVAEHGPGQFVGDIDLLTRRAVIVTAVAREETQVVRVKGKELRKLLGTVPKLGEKLLAAFTARRELLEKAGIKGLRVVGDANCAETNLVREFLFKNFVPYTWYDSEEATGRQVAAELKTDCFPAVECGKGKVLERPSLHELASCAGVVRPCPDRVYDVAIVGAGPAGLAAAVYAASEGLSTVVLDRLGPGGQAGGSSRIENFIGFPSGLSGNELALRGMLQMLKFGALLLSPVSARTVEIGDHEHVIRTSDEDVRAKVVLAATGARWRRLEAKGAAQFERNGIFYSATSVEQRVCSGKPIAIVGAGNSGAQAAMFLSECSPKVYLLVHGQSLASGMSAYLHQRIRAVKNIEVIFNCEVTEVFGESTEGVSAIRVTINGTESRDLEVGSVFVFIGAEPMTNWLPPEVARDDKGYVITGEKAREGSKWTLNRDPCPLETSIPRILAAGDIRSGSTKRVGFAVGDGSLAVTCIHRVLQGM